MRNKDREKLRSKLRNLRIRSGLTQLEVAERLGVDHRTISAFETGRMEPNIRVLSWYCQYFNVTPNQLLGFEEDHENEQSLSVEEEKLLNHYRKLPIWRKKMLQNLIEHDGPYIDTHEEEYLLKEKLFDPKEYRKKKHTNHKHII